MNAGVVWALVSAFGFGLTQILNRKSNVMVGAPRTAFGLLSAVEVILLGRLIVTGEYRLVAGAPLSALAAFVASGVIHYAIGWTLLAFSQDQVGVGPTGAIVSVTPLVASLLAVPILHEALTVWTLVGVVLAVAGVALVSLSRSQGRAKPVFPGFALAVAVCWGSSPIFIRIGLNGLDAPVTGLTVGLGIALILHAVILTALGQWSGRRWDSGALRWMALGGLTGAVGIGAQWISYGLTTVAIASTVQQLAVLVVVGLAPVVFGSKERVNGLLVGGTAMLLTGAVLIVALG
jgi:drug/metabolite transporter (DMT)-like permease